MAWRLIAGSFKIDDVKGILQSSGVTSFSVSHSIVYFEYSDAATADSVTEQIKQKYPVRLMKDFETQEELIRYLKYFLPYE